MVEEKGKKTVGELALEQQLKPYYEAPVEEFGKEILQENENYMKNLWEAVDRGIKEYNTDYIYVAVLSLRERLIHNVLRNKFIPRQTCPTPTYCQSVFKYEKELDRLQLLWTIPDRESCTMLLDAGILVEGEERIVLKHVLNFYDGTLDKVCQKENGEVIIA